MTAVRWDRVDALIDASPGLPDLQAHGLECGRGTPLARDRRPDSRGPRRRRAACDVAHAGRTARAGAGSRRLRRSGHARQGAGRGRALPRPDDPVRSSISTCSCPMRMLPRPRYERRASNSSGDPADYPDFLHHLPPVHAPDQPIAIEVHHRLKWVDGLRCADVPVAGGRGRAACAGGRRHHDAGARSARARARRPPVGP